MAGLRCSLSWAGARGEGMGVGEVSEVAWRREAKEIPQADREKEGERKKEGKQWRRFVRV